MGRLPWFKFYSADFLVDPDVDMLPLEAQGLLVRMWCICHLEGSCPDDPQELARKTRINLQSILLSKPLCRPFFKLLGDRLHSYRMDEEKVKSDRARSNALSKGKEKTSASSSASSSANGSANGSVKSPAQSQSQSHIKKQSQEREAKPPSRGYTETDFNERDLRKIGEAKKKLNIWLQKKTDAACGSNFSITNEDYYAQVAEESGVTVKRIFELEKWQKEWPESKAQ